jgi:hypothetical protein
MLTGAGQHNHQVRQGFNRAGRKASMMRFRFRKGLPQSNLGAILGALAVLPAGGFLVLGLHANARREAVGPAYGIGVILMAAVMLWCAIGIFLDSSELPTSSERDSFGLVGGMFLLGSLGLIVAGVAIIYGL